MQGDGPEEIFSKAAISGRTFLYAPHGPDRGILLEMRNGDSGEDDCMGLFRLYVPGHLPLSLPRRNLIAPSEKTSPRPSHNGWDPFCFFAINRVIRARVPEGLNPLGLFTGENSGNISDN